MRRSLRRQAKGHKNMSEMENNAKLNNLPEQPQRLEKLELIILAGAVILSIFVHGFFVMDGFGEPDAARMAVQAAGWHQMGRIPILSYPVRVSPLYLHTLKAVLDLGYPLQGLANLMNWANVIMGSLTLIPLYLLWRYLSTPKAAAIGCLLYSFTPAFWHANIYGMPHLPSFGFFAAALLLFAISLRHSGVRFVALASGSAILAALAVDLKADIILCYGAFFGIVVCLKSWNLRNVILSLLIPFIAVLSVLVYSKLIVPFLPGTGEFAIAWQSKFFTVKALLNRTNMMGLITAVGVCLFSAFILSMLYCIICRRNLRLLFMTLLWGLPGIIFSSFWIGNVSRHLMASCSVLMFLVAVAFVSLIRKMRFALPIIAVLLVLNNFAGPQRSARFQYGGRLIKPINEMQHLVDAVRKAGREFTALPDQRKIIVGSWSIPYIVWQVLEEARDFEIEWGNKQGSWASWAGNLKIVVKRKDNSSCIVRVMEIRKRPVKIPQPKGWRAWTCEPGIRLVKSPKN